MEEKVFSEEGIRGSSFPDKPSHYSGIIAFGVEERQQINSVFFFVVLIKKQIIFTHQKPESGAFSVKKSFSAE
jgi:hypothetical protein